MEPSSNKQYEFMRHFSIHDGEANVGRLLGKIQAEITSLGPIDVFDITFCAHHDGDDYVAEMTVYYWPKDEGE